MAFEPIHASESLGIDQATKLRHAEISKLITGTEKVRWFDGEFKPTVGQLLKLESMQRRLYTRNPSGNWCYHFLVGHDIWEATL